MPLWFEPVLWTQSVLWLESVLEFGDENDMHHYYVIITMSSLRKA